MYFKMQFLIGISFTSKKAAWAIDMFQIVSSYYYYFVFNFFSPLPCKKKEQTKKIIKIFFKNAEKRIK